MIDDNVQLQSKIIDTIDHDEDGAYVDLLPRDSADYSYSALDVKRKIESNDKSIVQVYMSIYKVFDWERAGKAIGENSMLKELTLCPVFLSYNEADMHKFFYGVSCNRSIRKVALHTYHNCNAHEGEVFITGLIPFFKNNGNLERLEISHQPSERDSFSRLLAAGLGEFSSLTSISLTLTAKACPEDELQKVLQGLTSHPNLRKLDLVTSGYQTSSTDNHDGVYFGRNTCITLAVLIHLLRFKLSVFHLDCDEICDEGPAILAKGLAGCTSLKDVKLRYWDCCEAWQEAFKAFRKCRKLNLWLSGISVSGLKAILGCPQQPNCALKELDLSGCGLNDEILSCLTNSLRNNISLTKLNLHDNDGITPVGWVAFTAVLRNPNSALEKLDVTNNQVNNEAMNSFAEALAHNSKLQKLSLLPSDGQLGAFSRALCNKTSIIDTYNSNHTLKEFSITRGDIGTFTRLNAKNSKSQAARLKIIKCHFQQGFDVPPFIDMELAVLPQALAWMARDNDGLEELPEVTHWLASLQGMVRDSAINEYNWFFYGYLRSMPLLFDINGKSKNRKRSG